VVLSGGVQGGIALGRLDEKKLPDTEWKPEKDNGTLNYIFPCDWRYQKLSKNYQGGELAFHYDRMWGPLPDTSMGG